MSDGGRAMSWSPKRAGFESGASGNSSWGRSRADNNILPDFRKWRAGLLFYLAKKNIPVEDRPDGTLVAKFGAEYKAMTPEMQWENYERYLDKITGTVLSSEFPFEEGAGIV
jgi:hypothetical protein